MYKKVTLVLSTLALFAGCTAPESNTSADMLTGNWNQYLGPECHGNWHGDIKILDR